MSNSSERPSADMTMMMMIKYKTQYFLKITHITKDLGG